MAPIPMDQIKRLLALACRIVLVGSILVDENEVMKIQTIVVVLQTPGR